MQKINMVGRASFVARSLKRSLTHDFPWSFRGGGLERKEKAWVSQTHTQNKCDSGCNYAKLPITGVCISVCKWCHQV